MKILVVGGAGYLGIPLSIKLDNDGHDVVIYDSFKYGNQHMIPNGINFIEADIFDFEALSNSMNTSDVVIYLAQPRLDELEIEDDSSGYIKYIAHILHRLNHDIKFYFASSCSVYGKQGNIVDENSDTYITSIYSKMKIKCERLILSKNNPNHKILRFSTLFGKSYLERTDVLINDFVDTITRKRKLYIFDSKSVRPHLHVLDCSNIISELINIDYDDKILNIGSNQNNVSKEKLVEILKKHSPYKFSVNQDEPNDSRSYEVNFDKLTNILSYDFISYDDGIKELFKREPKEIK